jgi:SAM-dependent methyltransferase
MTRRMVRTIVYELLLLGRRLLRLFVYLYLPLIAMLVTLHFPWSTDANFAEGRTAEELTLARRFYEAAYQPGQNGSRGRDYEETAAQATETYHIEGAIRQFVATYDLAGKKVLDVGSGRGHLQDAVADYTGLDLSPEVAQHYHKPFVVGSATDMPFPNHVFDAVWTVWVMEHIPLPQRAYEEMRRVVKPGGLLYLIVAWNVPSWLADGLEVRPYADFTLAGKLVKATLPIRRSVPFRMAHIVPTRLTRLAAYRLIDTDVLLRYRRLHPNYDVYWQADSDAAVSLDRFESSLWFESRGDRCLNCEAGVNGLLDFGSPLIIRVRH